MQIMTLYTFAWEEIGVLINVEKASAPCSSSHQQPLDRVYENRSSSWMLAIIQDRCGLKGAEGML